MKEIKSFAAFLAVLAMSGCGQSAQAEQKDAQIAELEYKYLKHTNGSINVLRDENRGVTCWVFDAYQRGGISCIPDWMLDRGAVEPESLGDQQ